MYLKMLALSISGVFPTTKHGTYPSGFIAKNDSSQFYPLARSIIVDSNSTFAI